MILKGKHIFRNTTRCLMVAIMAALAVSLILLMAAGCFSVPGADDYRYGTGTHAAWETERSFWPVAGAAGKETVRTYRDWQGSYFAIFLMSLQPGIYGAEWYWIGSWMLLLLFCVSLFVFVRGILSRLFQTSGEGALLGAGVSCLAAIWFVPFPVEAFYWYNGGVYYTFFFALSCLAGNILLRRATGTMRKRDGLLLPVLAVMIGGGNLVTGLLSCCIAAGAVLLTAAQKKRDVTVWVSTGILAAAFLVNVFAPGNAVRQAENAMRGAPGALTAVAWGIRDAALYSIKWMKNPGTWLVLAAVPWISVPEGKHRQVPGYLCAGCAIAGYLLLAAGFTPSEYALSMPGEARLIDIQYDLYLLVLLVVGLTCRAWLSGRAEKGNGLFRWRKGFTAAALFLCAAFMIAGRQGSCISAARILANGAADTYKTEWMARIRALEAPEPQVLVFPRLSSKPPLICQMDLASETDNPYYFYNEQVAGYYGKEQVLCEPEEEE